MKKNQHTLSTEQVDRMINMRINGFSLTTLSVFFGVHYTAIIWHLRKFKIQKPVVIYDIKTITKKILPKEEESKWIIIDGERINRGKSYAEYLYSYSKKHNRAYN